MRKPNQRVKQSQVPSGHVVQFFDGADTLGPAVASFLGRSSTHSRILLVARPSSIQAIARALSARGTSLQALIEAGSVTIVDAAATLQTLMNGAVVDGNRFHAVVGSLVTQLLDPGDVELLVYGEMVDILATEGNLRAASALEELWNRLLSGKPIALMCGYAAAHFTAPNGVEALRAICDRHARVEHDPADSLASWLLNQANISTATLSQMV